MAENAGTISKTGLIVYRGTDCPAELTIESAANSNDIYDFSANGNTYSQAIKDSKGGVHYVGYAILADGTVKYGEIVSTAFADLIAE